MVNYDPQDPAQLVLFMLVVQVADVECIFYVLRSWQGMQDNFASIKFSREHTQTTRKIVSRGHTKTTNKCSLGTSHTNNKT